MHAATFSTSQMSAVKNINFIIPAIYYEVIYFFMQKCKISSNFISKKVFFSQLISHRLELEGRSDDQDSCGTF